MIYAPYIPLGIVGDELPKDLRYLDDEEIDDYNRSKVRPSGVFIFTKYGYDHIGRLCTSLTKLQLKHELFPMYSETLNADCDI